jgi:hypothetical protein
VFSDTLLYSLVPPDQGVKRASPLGVPFSTERTSTTRSVVTQPLHPGQSYPTGSPVRVCIIQSQPHPSALLELGIYSGVIVIFY